MGYLKYVPHHNIHGGFFSTSFRAGRLTRQLLTATALCGTVLAVGVSVAGAQVTTRTTTVYTYDFPNQAGPSSESSTSTVVEQCMVAPSGGLGGDGPSEPSMGYDTNGDGWVDSYSPNADGSHHGQGGMGGISDGVGSDGGEGGRVICTYFYQKGMLDELLYYADVEYTKKHIHPVTVRGYHAWAIWYVERMRRSPGGLLERLIWPVTLHRARELAHKMGLEDRPDYRGRLFRAVLEPFSFSLGLFAKERDWRHLYAARDFRVFAQGYRRYQAVKLFRAGQAERRLAFLIRQGGSSAAFIGIPANGSPWRLA